MRLCPSPDLAEYPLTRRLWLWGGAWAFLVTAIVAGQTGESLRHPNAPLVLGFDLLPPYAAATLVRAGRYAEMYDPAAVEAVERRIMADAKLAGDARFGAWVNPPFVAWAYVPLARLPYRTAGVAFVGVNLVLLAAALVLLRRLLPAGAGWRAWGLIPLAVWGSSPFWQVMTHHQNTLLSLTILAAAVGQWRRENAFAAGAVAGLLAYKPQLAVAVAAVLVAFAGRRAVFGLFMTGAGLLAVTEWTMPGAMLAWLRGAPPIVRHLQTAFSYNWSRQSTLQDFWRLLIQGDAPGETVLIVKCLWAASWVAVAGPLAVAVWRARGRTADARERAVAAAVVCMPLLMPYYMDYDLLLLSVPAVLYAGRRAQANFGTFGRIDRWLPAAWVAVFAATVVNPFLAPPLRIHLTVLALVPLASLSVARCLGRDAAADTIRTVPQAALATAA